MQAKLLENEIFKIRYIDRNFDSPQNSLFSHENKAKIHAKIKQSPIKAVYLVPYLLFRSFFKKIHTYRHSKYVKQKIKANPAKALYLVPYYLLAKLTFAKSWDKIYNKYRLKYHIRHFYKNIDKEVHLPYFELVLTTRCTLRCESCYNLMQYFSPQSAYTCTLQGITAALDALFSVIDSVKYVRIIGGEPLLFKDIAKVALYLDKEKKVEAFGITTNGTVKPKDDLLEVLANSKKCDITMSDYSVSPNIKIPLYYEQIASVLKAHNIPYKIIWQDENSAWNDPKKIYKRGRNKENIIKNFKACLMPCVSVMSNECLPQTAGENAYHKPQIIRGGGAALCT